jgi:hypothetical protein
MAVLTQVKTDQLPPGAQLSEGNTKAPIGVIDDRLDGDGDVLYYQAAKVARARAAEAAAKGVNVGVYNGDPGTMDAGITRMVDENRYPGALVGMTQHTLNMLAQGTITRDQQFVGNNANFTGYYLEPGAKFVIPQYTPLRNKVARVPGAGIDTINWRAVTDYFGGSGPSVGQFIAAQQGTIQKLQYNWSNQSNVFKMLEAQDIVTFESEIYGRMFQGDVRATVAAKLIPALMQGQEIWMINGGQKLWAPAPPFNSSTATTGGTIANATNWIIVTAVNAQGETLASGTNTAVPSALSVVTAGSGTSTVTFTIARVPGATKYNVYVGTGTTQPANSAMWLQSATTQFGGATALNDTGGLATGYITVTATAAWATSGTAYSTVVTAGNTAVMYTSGGGGTPANLPLVYDGLQALIMQNQGNPSTLAVGGEIPFVIQPAAANGALAQSDVDNLLEKMFLNAHADPDWLACSVKDHRTLTYLVAQGTNFRVTTDIGGDGLTNLRVGGRATKYINQTTGKVLDILMLPYLTQGTLIVGSDSIPFPVTAIDKPIFRMEVNKEMWAMELPPDQSHPAQWMYNAFVNETMVIQYLGGFAAINGIKV